ARDFFFQAEDGIRDFHVTGVQTCALPICPPPLGSQAVAGGSAAAATVASSLGLTWLAVAAAIVGAVAALHFEPEHVPARVPRLRSAERRVGKVATGRCWSA